MFYFVLNFNNTIAWQEQWLPVINNHWWDCQCKLGRGSFGWQETIIAQHILFMWRSITILHHQPRLLPLVRSMCLSPNQIPSSQIKSSKWERLKLDLNCIDETILTSPRPSPSVKPKPKIQKRLKGNLASGLSLKSHGPPPITFRESGWEYNVQIEALSTHECQEGVPSPGGQHVQVEHYQKKFQDHKPKSKIAVLVLVDYESGLPLLKYSYETTAFIFVTWTV